MQYATDTKYLTGNVALATQDQWNQVPYGKEIIESGKHDETDVSIIHERGH